VTLPEIAEPRDRVACPDQGDAEVPLQPSFSDRICFWFLLCFFFEAVFLSMRDCTCRRVVVFKHRGELCLRLILYSTSGQPALFLVMGCISLLSCAWTRRIKAFLY